jgi:tetratricopeptide (TPR) repeat protein
VRRGRGKLYEGDASEAKGQFALARARIGKDPKHARIWADIARAWLDHGKAEEGLADAEAYVASGANESAAARLRGLLHQAVGRGTEALADLEKAIGLGAKDAEIYFARGRAHELTGNRTSAVADYQSALGYCSGDSKVRNAQDGAQARLKEMGIEPPNPCSR